MIKVNSNLNSSERPSYNRSHVEWNLFWGPSTDSLKACMFLIVRRAVPASDNEASCSRPAETEAVGLYESAALWPAGLLPGVLFRCTGAHSAPSEAPHCPQLTGRNSPLVQLSSWWLIDDWLCTAAPHQYKLPINHSYDLHHFIWDPGLNSK